MELGRKDTGAMFLSKQRCEKNKPKFEMKLLMKNKMRLVNSKNRYNNDANSHPVEVTQFVSTHDNGCEPGQNQYSWCKTKSGLYCNTTELFFIIWSVTW